MTVPRFRTCLAAASLVLAPALPASLHAPLHAQLRSFPTIEVGVEPVFEGWRFGNGLYQFDGAADSVRVSRVSQWSVPWSLVVPIGRRWVVDAGGAYVHGSVRFATPPAGTTAVEQTLVGPTDTKVRLVGRLFGDQLLVTLGANLPTGPTSLPFGDLQALRVLAAPALGLSTPAVGNGAGGTAGLIVTRQALGFGLAAGGSFEKRGAYAPVTAIVSGAGAPDYQPGDAVHVSLAADRVIGGSGMTLALTADFYGEDALTLREPDATSSVVAVKLGPTLSAVWQLRLASQSAREATLYLADRYRSSFERDGATVAGSSGHQVEGGVRSVLPLGERVGALFDVEGRYHTGLAVDNTLATTGLWSAGTTLGLRFGGSSFSATPFVRGRYAVLGTDDRTASGTSVAGGLSLTAHF